MAPPADSQLGYTLRKLDAAQAELDNVQKQHKGVIERVLAEQRALQDEIKALAQDLTAARSGRDDAEQRVKDVLGQVRDLRQQFDADKQTYARAKSIEDIPGIRTPQWYKIEITFASGATAAVFNTAEIFPEGPFVITQAQPYWRCQDTTDAPAGLNGRLLPVSAAALWYAQGGGDTAANIIANTTEIPELSFQIEIQGSGRFWTNDKIPGAAFYGNQAPLYTGIMGWVDPADRIKVHVTPEIATPHAGKVEFVFHGFQILNSVRQTQVLGSAS